MGSINTAKGSSPSKAHQGAINDAWNGGPENGNTSAAAMAGGAFSHGKRDVSPSDHCPPSMGPHKENQTGLGERTGQSGAPGVTPSNSNDSHGKGPR